MEENNICEYDFTDILKEKDKEIDKLNNIINELEWKPIEQYEKPKYDWVLIKYFIEPNFECMPCVAENRFGKWYDRNDNLINGKVRYFFDMQQLDKLKTLDFVNKMWLAKSTPGTVSDTKFDLLNKGDNNGRK